MLIPHGGQLATQPEVDLPILFQDKEPLLEGETLSVQSRTVVPTDFSSGEDWSVKLQNTDFDPTQPTVWLLEGLMMHPGLVLNGFNIPEERLSRAT